MSIPLVFFSEIISSLLSLALLSTSLGLASTPLQWHLLPSSRLTRPNGTWIQSFSHEYPIKARTCFRCKVEILLCLLLRRCSCRNHVVLLSINTWLGMLSSSIWTRPSDFVITAGYIVIFEVYYLSTSRFVHKVLIALTPSGLLYLIRMTLTCIWISSMSSIL